MIKREKKKYGKSLNISILFFFILFHTLFHIHHFEHMENQKKINNNMGFFVSFFLMCLEKQFLIVFFSEKQFLIVFFSEKQFLIVFFSEKQILIIFLRQMEE